MPCDMMRLFLRQAARARARVAAAAGLWSLDDMEDAATKAVLADAQARPERYVLKPQREGGGNNLYGAAAAERLRDPRGLAAYILMQRIRPPINRRARARLSCRAACHVEGLREA